MFNFILYEEDRNYINLYESLIHKFMGSGNDLYKIYKYTKYDDKILDDIKNLCGYNIYIISIEVCGRSGLDLAHDIRKVTDFSNNQIVLITEHIDLLINAYHRKLLIMDFLSKYDDLENNLLLCFREMYTLFNRKKSLAIKCCGEILRIPYNDILYIEKNKNDNYICIHTENSEYKYKSNITDVESHLKRDMCFLRSHRSAIVNVSQITKVDLVNNVIYFKYKKTNYLSRDRKRELEKQMDIVGRLL